MIRIDGGRAMAAALAASAVVAASLATVPALGQGGTWGAVFPEASRTGVPDWVRPGTRIVQYVASASVPQSRYALVEDPNGDLENPRTGKRYRRTDESGEGVGGGSGQGYSVIDVVSVSPDTVVGAVSLFTIDPATGALTYLPIGGGPEPAGAMDAVWLHPTIVAGVVAAGQAPGADLLVGSYPLGGVTYDVAALVSAAQDVSIDRASGIVVAAAGNVAGSISPVRLEGEDPPVGNSLRTYQQLLGTRDRTLDGIAAPVPAWLRGQPTLTYEGTYAIGGAAVPARTTLTVEQVGADWARMHATTEVGALGTVSTNEAWVVSGGTGPFWYDPVALASMRTGDVLDHDTLTGTTTRVADGGTWDGGSFVWIVTDGPAMSVWFQYDVATGVPMGYSLQQGGSDFTVWLRAMP